MESHVVGYITNSEIDRALRFQDVQTHGSKDLSPHAVDGALLKAPFSR